MIYSGGEWPGGLPRLGHVWARSTPESAPALRICTRVSEMAVALVLAEAVECLKVVCCLNTASVYLSRISLVKTSY